MRFLFSVLYCCDLLIQAHVYIRPFAREMLAAASQLAEVVLFTASTAAYADQVSLTNSSHAIHLINYK